MSQFADTNDEQEVICWRCGTWVSRANFTSHRVECFQTRRTATARPAPTPSPKRKKRQKVEMVPAEIKQQQKEAQAKPPSGGRAVKCNKCAQHIAESKFAQHSQNCQGPGSSKQAQAKPQQHKDQPKQRKTADGYLISRCNQCRQRICLLETTENNYECYDITHERKRGTIHLCDGERPVRRPYKLIYTGTARPRK